MQRAPDQFVAALVQRSTFHSSGDDVPDSYRIVSNAAGAKDSSRNMSPDEDAITIRE